MRITNFHRFVARFPAYVARLGQHPNNRQSLSLLTRPKKKRQRQKQRQRKRQRQRQRQTSYCGSSTDLDSRSNNIDSDSIAFSCQRAQYLLLQFIQMMYFLIISICKKR